MTTDRSNAEMDGTTMLIARTQPELARARDALGSHVALVPTMGALHEGHLALVDAARDDGSAVVASIFVNPLQFEAGADLARYPVDHRRDLEMLAGAGCAVAWLPTAEIMYATAHATTIDVGGPAETLEGTFRPGHFRGVATVVAILLGQTRPETIWLGEKDWQQLQVVRRMVADLRLPVAVRSAATIRDADGLALSSRNRFLSGEDRQKAPMLYRSLTSTVSSIRQGREASAALAECRSQLERAGFDVDYVVLAEAESLIAVEQLSPNTRLLAAARLGSVRLLDNLDASVSVPPKLSRNE